MLDTLAHLKGSAQVQDWGRTATSAPFGGPDHPLAKLSNDNPFFLAPQFQSRHHKPRAMINFDATKPAQPLVEEKIDQSLDAPILQSKRHYRLNDLMVDASTEMNHYLYDDRQQTKPSTVFIHGPRGSRANDIMLEKAIQDFENEEEKGAAKSNIVFLAQNWANCHVMAERMLMMAKPEDRAKLYKHMEVLDRDSLRTKSSNQEPRIIFISTKLLKNIAGSTSDNKTSASDLEEAFNPAGEYGLDRNLDLTSLKYLYIDRVDDYLSDKRLTIFEYLKSKMLHDPKVHIVGTSFRDPFREGVAGQFNLKTYFDKRIDLPAPADFVGEQLMPGLEAMYYPTRIGEATSTRRRRKPTKAAPGLAKKKRSSKPRLRTFATLAKRSEFIDAIAGKDGDEFDKLVELYRKENSGNEPQRIFIRCQNLALLDKIFRKLKDAGITVARTHSFSDKTLASDKRGAKAAGAEKELNMFTDEDGKKHYRANKIDLLRGFGSDYQVMMHCGYFDGMEIPADAIMLVNDPFTSDDNLEDAIASVRTSDENYPEADSGKVKIAWFVNRSERDLKEIEISVGGEKRKRTPAKPNELLGDLGSRHEAGEYHQSRTKRAGRARDGEKKIKRVVIKGPVLNQDETDTETVFKAESPWIDYLDGRLTAHADYESREEGGFEHLANFLADEIDNLNPETALKILENRARNNPHIREVLQILESLGIIDLDEAIKRYPKFAGILSPEEAFLRVNHIINKAEFNKALFESSAVESGWLDLLNKTPIAGDEEAYERLTAEFLFGIQNNPPNPDPNCLKNNLLLEQYLNVLLGVSDRFQGNRKKANDLQRDFYAFLEAKSPFILPASVNPIFPHIARFKIESPEEAFKNTAYLLTSNNPGSNPQWFKVLDAIKVDDSELAPARAISQDQARLKRASLIARFLFQDSPVASLKDPNTLLARSKVLLGTSDELPGQADTAAANLRKKFYQWLKNEREGLVIADAQEAYPDIASLADDITDPAEAEDAVKTELLEQIDLRAANTEWSKILDGFRTDGHGINPGYRANRIADYLFNSSEAKAIAFKNPTSLRAAIGYCLGLGNVRNGEGQEVARGFYHYLKKAHGDALPAVVAKRALPKTISLEYETRDPKEALLTVRRTIENNGIAAKAEWRPLLAGLKPKTIDRDHIRGEGEVAIIADYLVHSGKESKPFTDGKSVAEACSRCLGGLNGEAGNNTIEAFYEFLDENYRPPINPFRATELFPQALPLEKTIGANERKLALAAKYALDQGLVTAPQAVLEEMNPNPKTRLAARLAKHLKQQGDWSFTKSPERFKSRLSTCLGSDLRSVDDRACFSSFATAAGITAAVGRQVCPEAFDITKEMQKDSTHSVADTIATLIKENRLEAGKKAWVTVIDDALIQESSALFDGKPEARARKRAMLAAEFFIGEQPSVLESEKTLIQAHNRIYGIGSSETALLEKFIKFLEKKGLGIANITLFKTFPRLNITDPQKLRNEIVSVLSFENFDSNVAYRLMAEEKPGQEETSEWLERIKQLFGLSVEKLFKLAKPAKIKIGPYQEAASAIAKKHAKHVAAEEADAPLPMKTRLARTTLELMRESKFSGTAKSSRKTNLTAREKELTEDYRGVVTQRLAKLLKPDQYNAKICHILDYLYPNRAEYGLLGCFGIQFTEEGAFVTLHKDKVNYYIWPKGLFERARCYSYDFGNRKVTLSYPTIPQHLRDSFKSK